MCLIFVYEFTNTNNDHNCIYVVALHARSVVRNHFKGTKLDGRQRGWMDGPLNVHVV